jgi:hypothetical protein
MPPKEHESAPVSASILSTPFLPQSEWLKKAIELSATPCAKLLSFSAKRLQEQADFLQGLAGCADLSEVFKRQSRLYSSVLGHLRKRILDGARPHQNVRDDAKGHERLTAESAGCIGGRASLRHDRWRMSMASIPPVRSAPEAGRKPAAEGLAA